MSAQRLVDLLLSEADVAQATLRRVEEQGSVS